MKIKVIVLFFISLCIFNTDVFAQEKQKLSIFKGKTKKDNVENVDSFKLIADSLYRELLLRDSIVRINTKLVDSLKQNAIRDSLRFSVAINYQRDSLLNIINIKDREITTLKANTGFVDTCMVRLANHWLYEKFNKTEVDKAIKYFDRIYSSKFKEDMSIVQELLCSYESAYQEFQLIIKQAQNDIDRENPFSYEKYKSKYKERIENMSYYKKFYNGDWNIRYLNGQITEVIKILNNHSIEKFADFTSFID